MNSENSSINKMAAEQIGWIQKACERIKPLVVIQCTAYNHEPYIKEALEGFIMQKTNFPFVAIVHDDASTDNTAEIIKEYAEKYPDIILPIYEEENQYSKKDGSLRRIVDAACQASDAKYIAMCEGDDYWIDPLKLQKQVDFLESDSKFGMCYTQVQSYLQEKKIYGNVWGGPNISFDDLIQVNTIPTLTVLIRTSLMLEYNKEISHLSRNWKMGDYPLWLFVAYRSNLKFINEVTGVYRILSDSASHSKNHIKRLEFTQSSYRLRIDLLKFFNLENHPYYKELIFNDRYLSMRISILKQKNIKEAITSFRRIFINSKISIKTRIKSLKWFIFPKALSKLASFRFQKNNNQLENL